MNTKRILAFALSVLMVLSILPANALAALVDYDESTNACDCYNVISKTDYAIAPGITESEIVLNFDDGSRRQVLHVMEADTNNEYVSVINSYYGMNPEYGSYQVGTMSQQTAWIEENMGLNVVGAMNTTLSWYDSARYKADQGGDPKLANEPLGFIMYNGEVVYDECHGFPTVLVINKDVDENGNPRPADIPKVEMVTIQSSDDLDGWEYQIIPASSGFIVKDGVSQYTAENHKADSSNSASRSVVGIKPDGTVIALMNDGRQAPYSTGMSMYELAEVMISLGCSYAVNCDGGGSSTFLSQRPGEDLKINCSPSDGAERPTTTGIVFVSTAPADGQFARANISTDSVYYSPESTVTFNVIGTDLVGNVAEIPADATWQIKEDGMGTIENGVFVSNGTVGTVTAQMVYNGNVVGEASIEIVIPTAFSFAQSVMTVPFDKTVTIGIRATVNEGRNDVTLKDGDVTFTTTNEALGTFNGLEFTSVAEENAPENLKSTVTATFNYGEGLVATAELNLGKASDVIFDFEDGMQGWGLGDVNQTAGYGLAYDTSLTHVTAENGQVHDGNGALKFYMNGLDQPNAAGSYKQFAIYADEEVIIENAKSIGVWVYIPDDMYSLWVRIHYWVDANGDGTYETKNTIGSGLVDAPYVYNSMDESGWKYISVDISAYSSIMLKAGKGVYTDAKDARFLELNAKHCNTDAIFQTLGTINGAYTFYIDSITVDYSDAVDDREAPVFSAVNMIGANDTLVAMENNQLYTSQSNVLSFNAQVAENTAKTNATGLNPASAKAYIDGVAVDCSYSNGKITVSNVAVADGAHRIKFEISDYAGNKSTVIRVVKVESGVDASGITVVPADATLDRLYGGSLYWMNVNASKIETIQSITAEIDLNSSNHWELDNMILAKGFTSSYTVNEETNTATITITRTGENDQTGEAVLAALPIRVIYYDTDMKQDGYTAESYWKTYNFWPHDLKVDVDKGVITFVDGYTASVLNAFSSEEYAIDTEMYTDAAHMDAAYRNERGTCHVHTAEAVEDKAATCTESGYTGRTYCNVCKSIVDWGTTEEALGHDWQINADGKLACANNAEELYTGTYEGKEYVDGVVIADGWVEVEGVKTYYYKDGVKLTGSHILDGVMCTFDESGAYLSNYQYEGFYEVGDTVMYFLTNKHTTGYTRINSLPYFFDDAGLGYDGVYTIGGETCTFDNGTFISSENAKVVEAGWCGEKVDYVLYDDGKLVVTGEGAMENYGTVPSPWANHVQSFVKTIVIGNGITDIGTNSFRNAFWATSIVFEENSSLKRIAYRGFENLRNLKSVTLPESLEILAFEAFGYTYALTNIYMPAGLTMIDANAFNKTNANLVMDVEAGSLAESFAEEKGIDYTTREKLVLNGVHKTNGVLYYYVDNVPTAAGLVQVDGDYYYASTGGVVKTGKYWVSRTNDLKPAGFYFFDEETGKMIVKNGVYTEDDGIFYYVDDVRTSAGLVKVGDYYYYASTGGAVKTGKYWVSRTNDLLTAGYYVFDAEGKLEIKNGVFTEEDGIFYYVNGVRTSAGLIKLDGYYYYTSTGGAVKTGKYWVSRTNDLLPAGYYVFDEEGKLAIKNGIYSEDGALYYYVDGVRTSGGLVMVDGDYYYASTGGAVKTGKYWVSRTNGLLSAGYYNFDAETGKMVG